MSGTERAYVSMVGYEEEWPCVVESPLGTAAMPGTAARSRFGEFSLRRIFSLALVCLGFVALLGLRLQPARAEAAHSAYDLIASVNQLRAANGLPAYQVNSALMSAAQGHSNYQASIGSITHTGSGGTRPRDRAAAAGYGGGATIYVSENIAGGASLTTQGAVQMWQGDSLHLNTMLGASYTDVGAGVATDGSMTYYTLDVGYVAGSPGGGSGSGSTSAPGGSPQAATAVAFYPVVVATPRPDGSVVHEVQAGQTLWSIAATYEIDLAALLELNNLSRNAFIYPGDKLLIRPASDEAQAEVTPAAASPAAKTTPTRRPTRTLKPTAGATANGTGENGASGQLSPSVSGVAGLDPILIALGGLAALGALLAGLGYLLGRGGAER